MSELFLQIVNMSIAAGWIVPVVLVLRLLLKKAPKWITVLLWGIVAVRLLCPVAVESAVSLIPSAQTIDPEITAYRTPQIHTGISVLNSTINPIIQSSTVTVTPEKDVNTFLLLIPVFAGVWLAGMAGMLVYGVVSYLRVKRRVGTAVLLRDRIYQSEGVASPFVLGVIKPKIYLPFQMEEQDMAYVIAHEQAHIRRKDTLWKPLGFLLLTLHWFNPLLWLGYVLLCRDIELACDEKVVKGLSREQRADYSQALLSCSVDRPMIAACPVAFGEVGVKDRVKSVLSYKKPAFWIIVLAILASILVAVCFLTNPRTTVDEQLSIFIDGQICEHYYDSEHTDDHFIAVHHKILDVDSTPGETTVYMWVMYQEYSNENGQPQLQTGAHVPTVITARTTGAHGHYELVEYWEPRDGAYYAEDIKAKFPRRLHSKALDPQRYVEEQRAFCQKAAQDYYANWTEPDDQLVPAHVITQEEIDRLRAKYPRYFGLDTAKGLEVYVWQMAADSYYWGLLPGNDRNYTRQELWDLHTAPASLGEMQTIVATYIPLVSMDDVAVIPITMPHSSYSYKIDAQYHQRVKELFWTRFPIISSSGHVAYIDAATFDIDGDGYLEQCTLGYGPTSGLFTFTLSTWQVGSPNDGPEYYNIFMGDWGTLSFANVDGIMKLKCDREDGTEPVYYTFRVEDGNVALYNGDRQMGYWGPQGVGSMMSAVRVGENGDIQTVISYPAFTPAQ